MLPFEHSNVCLGLAHMPLEIVKELVSEDGSICCVLRTLPLILFVISSARSFTRRIEEVAPGVTFGPTFVESLPSDFTFRVTSIEGSMKERPSPVRAEPEA